MHSVTNLGPAPGVLSAFDEKATAVIATTSDEWHYLTGEKAWVWQVIRVTGNTSVLEAGEIHHAVEFLRQGILTTNPLGSPLTAPSHPSPEIRNAQTRALDVPPRSALRREATRAWKAARDISELSFADCLHALRAAHENGLPYAPKRAVSHVWREVSVAMPWWFPESRRTGRNIALATTMLIQQLGGRVDFSFGMCHRTQGPAFWCTTPEGPLVNEETYLAVGSA